ncbi:MAG: response regulator [Planctomycetota bacterium]
MTADSAPSILIVDDELADREQMAQALREAGYGNVSRAESCEMARHLIRTVGPFALVILNIRMPGESGLRLLKQLAPRAPDTVVIMETSGHGLMTAIDALKQGAYDYLLKPIDDEALQLAVGNALKRRQRELDERAEYEDVDALLERRLGVMEETQRALLRAVCRLAEFGKPEGHVHPERVARYSYLIARRLADHSPYAPFVDEQFLQNIPECALLHDIGKLALPPRLLQKPGELTEWERANVERHAGLGRQICREVRSELDTDARTFIDMAIEVTGSHHERWDGEGYPDALAGADIPLSARIVSLADYYDVWRRPMVYRPEVLERSELVERIRERAGSKFDPVVVRALRDCREQIAEAEQQLGE